MSGWESIVEDTELGVAKSNRLKRREILRRMNLLEKVDQVDSLDWVVLKPSEEACLTVSIKDLLLRFHRMDPASTGLIGMKDLKFYVYQTRGRRHGADTPALSDAIQQFNVANNFTNSNDSPARQSLLSFEAFVEMMLMEDLTGAVSDECAQLIHEVRRHLLVDEATLMVADKTGLSQACVADEVKVGARFHKLDIAGLMVLLLNAIVIGVSADYVPQWVGYPIMEYAFTAFFACECLYKIRCNGLRDYFLGEDKVWNVFEIVLILAALSEFMIENTFSSSALGKPKTPLLRLLRLARLTRAVRVLRFKMFKELILMIGGIMSGCSTMLWVVVLLLMVIYILGVGLKILIGPDQAFGCHESPGQCTSSMVKMDQYRTDLFSTVSRSMFTVFRCFVDGCAAPDGTPLMIYVYNVYGWIAMFMYVIVMFAVTFGLFNLIMAIFVENTLESAKASEQRRHELKRQEYIKTAHDFNNLIIEFIKCEGKGHGEVSMITGLDHETFCAAVRQPAVIRMLQDLDIIVLGAEDLFDILDADMSGTVTVRELVNGLMKLRGSAGKADAVAALLSLRSLQKSVSSLEIAMMRQFAGLQRSLSEILTSEMKYNQRELSRSL